MEIPSNLLQGRICLLDFLAVPVSILLLLTQEEATAFEDEQSRV